MRRRGASLFCMIVIGAALVVGPGAGAATISCGQTIKSDVKLSNSLFDCLADGLIVGKSGIVLDLNGHVIDGDAAGAADAGIRLVGRKNVRIIGGTIQGFGVGVLFEQATSGSKVKGSTIRRNTVGIRIHTSTANHVVDTDVVDNGSHAVELVNADSNRVAASRIVKNGAGISGDGTSDLNVFTDSLVADHIVHGVGLSGSDNQVRESDVVGNLSNGLFLGGFGNVADGNRVLGNGNPVAASGHGISLLGIGSPGATVANNHVVSNVADGIRKPNPGAATIAGNTVNFNGVHGIEVELAAAVDDNTALANGFPSADNVGDGIFAQDIEETVTGAGNAAGGNEGAAQCAPPRLCQGVVPPPPPTQVTCGETIMASITLANSLLDCPENGLEVGANDVTIDLAGHLLDGDDAGTGAGVLIDGATGVTVRNGVIKQFASGIDVDGGSHDATIENNTIIDGAERGIRLKDSDNAAVSRNLIVSSGLGVTLHGTSTGNTIERNDIDGGVAGIEVSFSAPTNTVRDNTVSGQTFGVLIAGNGSTIQRNRIVAADESGVLVSGSSNVLKKNVVRASGLLGDGADGAFVISEDQNSLLKNRAQSNAGAGLRIRATADLTVVKYGRFNRNVADGIDDDGTTSTISANVANKNLEDGIDASGDATVKGSGNVAANNAGDDCLPVTLC